MKSSLKQTLARFDISNIELSEVMNCTKETVSLKVNGKTIITLKEAFDLQDYIKSKYDVFLTIDEIFNNN